MKNIQKFEILQNLDFNRVAQLHGDWYSNWPVVYILHNDQKIYVGETLSVKQRLATHSGNKEKKYLVNIELILSRYFNKSATLGLESELINLFFADGKYEVINRNNGVVKANYYYREGYEKIFAEIFNELRRAGLFNGSINDIRNNDLFKLSPFKTLTADQANVSARILSVLAENLEAENPAQQTFVVDGMPGTGKTVLSMFLLKFVADVAAGREEEGIQLSDEFEEIINAEVLSSLRGVKIGFVIPQKSLRKSVQQIIKRIPNLDESMVLDPFALGKSREEFDILLVDEAHRLGQRSNQSIGARNVDFARINEDLFGEDNNEYTQLDWVKAKSKVQILFLDESQSVKPGDLPLENIRTVVHESKSQNIYYKLESQMRLNAPYEYIKWIESLLSGQSGSLFDLGDYDLKFFESVTEMRREILEKEAQFELSRMIAGYAWEWKSKKDKSKDDIIIDDVDGQQFKAKWNSVDADWIASRNSVNEIGSIHTVQGYDLNYAGVIIGNDIFMDPNTGRVHFSRSNYYDKKGKENNRRRGIEYTDDDILKWVQNIYRVLLTRGILGTYIYVCDENLRKFMMGEFTKLRSFKQDASINMNPDFLYSDQSHFVDYFSEIPANELTEEIQNIN